MMRKILILRHAKAELGSMTLPDFDRQLMPRGRKAATTIGRYLANANLTPDFVICSAAARTRETLDLLVPAFDAAPAITYEPLIYEAPYERILHVLRKSPGAAGTVLIVGHNPGLEDLVDALMMTAEEEAEREARKDFPTCALAVMTVKVAQWDDVTEQSAHLERFVTPRTLA